ncbi:MAG: hypothetical protein A2X64_10265 [Ignavibacteria bacterium GWF2_33_9]|nr:MAG: hypothetical protein A2X64_10265 [Ignavibacteria bacterium GWF2_33_9]
METKFTIQSFSTKKFNLIFFIAFIIIVALTIFITLEVAEYLVAAIFILLIPIILLSRKLAIKNLELTVGTGFLKINDKTIDLKSVKGYHFYEKVALIISFDILYNEKNTLTIPCLNTKANSAKFHEFMKTFINECNRVNPDAVPMNYQEVHVKEIYILRPIIILGLVLIGILDLYMIYGLFFGGVFLWGILLMNILILSFIPYLKKKKKNPQE